MAIQTTNTTAAAWSPDVYTYAPADVVPEALIMRTTDISGSVNGDAPSVRVAYVKDAESADFVAEGTEIPDDNADLDEVVIHTRKISRLATISSEQFEQENTAGNLATSFARDIVRKADNAFLALPTGGPLTGLLHATGLVDGGVVGDNLDALVDLVAALENNGANPSVIVVDPLSWAALRKLKVGGSDTNQTLSPCCCPCPCCGHGSFRHSRALSWTDRRSCRPSAP